MRKILFLCVFAQAFILHASFDKRGCMRQACHSKFQIGLGAGVYIRETDFAYYANKGSAYMLSMDYQPGGKWFISMSSMLGLGKDASNYAMDQQLKDIEIGFLSGKSFFGNRLKFYTGISYARNEYIDLVKKHTPEYDMRCVLTMEDFDVVRARYSSLTIPLRLDLTLFDFNSASLNFRIGTKACTYEYDKKYGWDLYGGLISWYAMPVLKIAL
jgi:hypothetical protein